MQTLTNDPVRRFPVIALLVMAVLFMVSGCVTTTDSRFAREADRDKAVENYVRLATAYLQQGSFERSRGHLERALELDSDNSSALAVQGLLYQAEGEVELASDSFQRSMRSDANNTRGRVFYGAFLYNQRDFAGARDQFERATRDTGYDDRSAVFFNLGLTEEQLGNSQGAVSAYRRAVELNRSAPRPLLALSRNLVEEGLYSEASRHYSRFVSIVQNNPNLSHSPESLLVGLRLARHFRDYDQESSLALVLRNRFPDSRENEIYRSLVENDER